MMLGYKVIKKGDEIYIVDTLKYSYRYLLLFFAWIIPVKAYRIKGNQSIDNKSLTMDDRGYNRKVITPSFLVYMLLNIVLFILQSKHMLNITIARLIVISIYLIVIVTIYFSIKKYRELDCDIILEGEGVEVKLSCEKNDMFRFVILSLFTIIVLYSYPSFIVANNIPGAFASCMLLYICVISLYSQWYSVR